MDQQGGKRRVSQTFNDDKDLLESKKAISKESSDNEHEDNFYDNEGADQNDASEKSQTTTASIKRKSVSFDNSDKRRSSMVRKLGPLGRKRQRSGRGSGLAGTITDVRPNSTANIFHQMSREESVEEDLDEDVEREGRMKGMRRKAMKHFSSWKKQRTSKEESDPPHPLASIKHAKDVILGHTSIWGQAHSGHVDQVDETGLAVLHVAAQSNDVDLIEDLIQRGADVTVKSSVDGATPLHMAARYNCLKATEILLHYGADVTDALTNGQIALHVCCRRGHLKLAKILIESGKSDVNSRDKDKFTPLHQATLKGDINVCVFLVEHKADICAKDINNVTPLMLAAQGGFLDVVQYFLTVASQMDIPIVDYLSYTDSEGSSALHLAVGNRHILVAKFLIGRGSPVNARKSSNGYTALHQAATIGDAALVQMLIDKGAETEVSDREQMTPLHRAALYNRVDTILILIRQGLFLDARDEDNLTPLLCAAWKGQTDAGRSLLRYGADVRVVDKEMKTCLHWAVETQHVEFAKMLFEQGHGGEFLLELPDRREQTPLHYASEVGNLQLVEFLIQHGAKVDLKDDEEKTSLHIASESGNLDCVMALLDACPVPLNDDDIDDMTPLLLASQNGHHRVVKYLIKMGADLESRNDDRRSSLALAVQNNQLEVIPILIDNNADVNAVDKDKNTPLHLCAQAGHETPVGILLNSGADVRLPNNYGKYPLDVAIENRHGCVAKAMLSNKSWEISMSNYDANGLSPMKRLIEVLPEAALQVMDQCVTRSHDDVTDVDLKVTYDYRYIDPGPDDISYDKNNGRFFALETMVEYDREKLLAHELAQNILARKWKRFAAYCNYYDFFMYVTFLIASIVYLDRLRSVKLENPTQDRFGCLTVNFSSNLTNGSTIVDFISELGYTRSTISGDLIVYIRDNLLVGIQFYILLFILYSVCREIPGLLKQPRKYINKWESWLHWTLYVAMFRFIYPPFNAPCDENWAWGAFGVFTTWMNFIFILQRFDFYGLYVTMFFTTLKSLLKAMSVYSFFIVGFGLAFFICFEKTNESFRDEWQSIITTFVMTLGEINKSDLLDSGVSLYPFDWVANILLVIFLFLMPMVLINLTIGISVGDIEEILQSSYLQRFGLQVEIIIGYEKTFPRWLQRKVWLPKAVYKPNKRKMSKLQKLSSFILGSSTNTKFLRKKKESETVKPTTLDHVMQEIVRHEEILSALGTMMYRQGELLHRVAESHGIFSEVEDISVQISPLGRNRRRHMTQDQ